MKKMFIMLLLLTITVLGCKGKPVKNEAIINKFPVISTQDLSRYIASNRGKPTLVNFFATWCAPCRKEIPELIKLFSDYKGKVAVVGLSVDEGGNQVLVPFANEAGFNYPVYLASQELSQFYQVSSIPATFVFDKNGTLVGSFSGYVDYKDLKQVFDKLI